MNPAADPEQSDIRIIGAKGIYRLERDILTLSISDAGDPRPTEFVSRPGSSVTFTVCRRARKPEGIIDSAIGTAEAESQHDALMQAAAQGQVTDRQSTGPACHGFSSFPGAQLSATLFDRDGTASA